MKESDLSGWYFGIYKTSWQWAFIYSESPSREEVLDQHEWHHDYVSRTLVGLIIRQLNSLALLYDLAKTLDARSLWEEPFPAISRVGTRYIRPDDGTCEYLEGATLLSVRRAASSMNLEELRSLANGIRKERRSKGMRLNDLDKISITNEVVQAFKNAGAWSKEQTAGHDGPYSRGVRMQEELLKVGITDFALVELCMRPKSRLIEGFSGPILLFDTPDYRSLVQGLTSNEELRRTLVNDRKRLFARHRDLWCCEMSQALKRLDFQKFPRAAYSYVYCAYCALQLLVSDFSYYMNEHIDDDVDKSSDYLTDKTGPLFHYLNDGAFAKELQQEQPKRYVEVLDEARPMVQELFPKFTCGCTDKDIEYKSIRRYLLLVNGFVLSFLEDVHDGYCNNSIFEFKCPYRKIWMDIYKYTPNDDACQGPLDGLLKFSSSLCSEDCNLKTADCTFICSADKDTYELANLRRRSFFHEMLYQLLIRGCLKSLLQ